MKKLIVIIFKWILARAEQYSIEDLIKEKYRSIAQKDLILTTRIIRVKKGSSKYHCLVIETPEGVRRISLKRHEGMQVDYNFVMQKAS